jgi:hypothetical protein
MRVVVVSSLVVALASLVPAQTSREFHYRYGDPDLERFTVRPGISLTVQFGSDHLACQALLEPPQSLIHEEWIPPAQATLMPSPAVSEVLEELIPRSMRGKHISDSSLANGCSVGFITEYENVSIMRLSHECGPYHSNRDISTSIIFKRDICPTAKAPWQRNAQPTQPNPFRSPAGVLVAPN